jgi:hypothetical protein
MASFLSQLVLPVINPLYHQTHRTLYSFLPCAAEFYIKLGQFEKAASIYQSEIQKLETDNKSRAAEAKIGIIHKRLGQKSQ